MATMKTGRKLRVNDFTAALRKFDQFRLEIPPTQVIRSYGLVMIRLERDIVRFSFGKANPNGGSQRCWEQTFRTATMDRTAFDRILTYQNGNADVAALFRDFFGNEELNLRRLCYRLSKTAAEREIRWDGKKQ